MPESFEDRVAAHLDGTQKKIAEANKTAHQKRQEEIEFLNAFDAMAKKVIQPTLMAARDQLLGRNIPSDVVFFRNDDLDRPTSSIALCCSNRDREQTMSEVRVSPQFKIYYMAQSQKVWWINLKAGVTQPKDIMTTIEAVSIAQVEEYVMEFLKLCNPH